LIEKLIAVSALPLVVLLTFVGCATRQGGCYARDYAHGEPQGYAEDSRACEPRGIPGSPEHEKCLGELGWSESKPSVCSADTLKAIAALERCMGGGQKTEEELYRCMEENAPNWSPNLEIKTNEVPQ
jgi:hypothetical protein